MVGRSCRPPVSIVNIINVFGDFGELCLAGMLQVVLNP